MILFIIVYVSGIVGVLLQQALPRLMLTRVPLETVYEQIDSVVLQLLAESDGLVTAACGPLPVERRSSCPTTGGPAAAWRRDGRASPARARAARPVALAPVPESRALRETYLRDIRPFLDPHSGAQRDPRHLEPRRHALPESEDDAAGPAAGHGHRAGGHL